MDAVETSGTRTEPETVSFDSFDIEQPLRDASQARV
jgi:hypothetical protein